MHLRIASTVAGLGALAATALAQGVTENRTTFTSGGQSIGVESFVPNRPGTYPAVIVVHGAGGIDYGNGYIRQLATALASGGVCTYLVHYFDRSGTHYADDATIRKNFESWLQTLGDGVTFVGAQPTTEKGKVAVFGYSLGGYLAVALGGRDERVKAVVELAGGIDPSYAAKTEKMPPTLVLHGQEDRRVLPQRAKELETLLTKLGTPFETKFYRGEGHVLSPMAALDALTRGLTFLNQHLSE